MGSALNGYLCLSLKEITDRELNISDNWAFFDIAGVSGSIAALVFVGWQAILTRDQLRLAREQMARAWLGAPEIACK
jgi:hypothetical protein